MGDWHATRPSDEEDARRLRMLWDQGKASGGPVQLKAGALKRDARRRLQRARRRSKLTE